MTLSTYYRTGRPRFSRPLVTIFTLALVSSLLAFTPVLAAPPSASLDQCGNGKFSAPTDCDPLSWQNGNLNANQAHYNEGDSVPYRLRFDNLGIGDTHTVTIGWDTTKGGKHALDYLTSFDRTVTTANPCVGVAGCAAPATLFAIPPDPAVTNAGVAQVGGNFSLYGGAITGASAYSMYSGTYAGDSSTQITLTFTATVANPVLAWGGHIATRIDWGAESSAVAINGSPFHMRLLDIDGKGGNQDRSLSNDAVVFPAVITVVKHSNSPDSTVFPFTAAPLPLTNFNLTDSSASTDAQQVFTLTDPAAFNKAYTVTEAPPTGWTLQSISCSITTSFGGSVGTDLGTKTATINLKEGDLVTCTFTNQAVAPKLTLIKNVDNDAGGTAVATDWTFSAAGASGSFSGQTLATITTEAGFDSSASTGIKSMVAGVEYTLSESGPSGYAASNWTCTGGGTYTSPNKITLTYGDDVTCRITNTDTAPTLTLIKNVTIDDGLTAEADDWTLSATGTGGFTGATLTAIAAGTYTSRASSGAQSVQAGVGYVLSESATPAGYTASAWSCDGGTLVGSTVTLALASNVTCQITNDDDPFQPTGTTVMSWVLKDYAEFTIRSGAGDASSAKIQFKLYSDDDCETQVGTTEEIAVDLTESGKAKATTATGVAVSSTGTYYWRAFYTGDAYNNTANTACGTEITTITTGTPGS